MTLEYDMNTVKNTAVFITKLDYSPKPEKLRLKAVWILDEGVLIEKVRPCVFNTQPAFFGM